jgi:hypothetical protein
MKLPAMPIKVIIGDLLRLYRTSQRERTFPVAGGKSRESLLR